MRLAARAVPGVDLGLQLVALGEQRAVPRRQRRDHPLEAVPEGLRIDTGAGQHLPIDKIGEDLRHLQPARPDVVDHGRAISPAVE